MGRHGRMAYRASCFWQEHDYRVRLGGSSCWSWVAREGNNTTTSSWFVCVTWSRSFRADRGSTTLPEVAPEKRKVVCRHYLVAVQVGPVVIARLPETLAKSASQNGKVLRID